MRNGWDLAERKDLRLGTIFDIAGNTRGSRMKVRLQSEFWQDPEPRR
jgi:hypothetical protein